ncbi:MAG TPA: polysaccharide ABC transporter ATP-binding protein [Pirellulales bacterium]|nr:polysaccharide ABC transporter ATP-binding protein [Pirellulales bacterium]
MSDVVIRVDQVWKRFKLYHNLITGPIKEHVFFWKREQYYQEFMAVQDVSFEVQRGEVVGIIGPNGAGKTTLLKMIAGLLPVDRGRIEVRGKVTALLALGVGVHPEFSGRENILYGGMLLGMSKREVLRKTESIVEFAELGEFIDRPLRTYSAGMRARLLFSISMSIDPDILIVDEALATGDSYFVGKSLGRIHEMCSSGATVLFVSHNMGQIQNLCSRGLVLMHGRLIHNGGATEAVARYAESVLSAQQASLGQTGPRREAGRIQLRDAGLLVEGRRSSAVMIGEPCQLFLDVECQEPLEDVLFFVQVRSEKCPTTYAVVPTLGFVAEPFQSLSLPAGASRVLIDFPQLNIGDGGYWCDVGFFDRSLLWNLSYERCYCYQLRALSFSAVYRDSRYFGRGTMVELPMTGVRIIPGAGDTTVEDSRKTSARLQ